MIKIQKSKITLVFFSFLLCVSLVFAESSSKYHQIREVQSLLYRADFEPGPINGKWSKRTEAALIQFLHDRGYQYEGHISERELQILRAEPAGYRYRTRSFTSSERPISQTTSANGVITFPGWELPQFLNPPPNDQTLAVYFSKWLDQSRSPRYTVSGSDNPRPITTNNNSNEFLENQLRYGSILSYLFYDGSQIIYDASAPEKRFYPHFAVNNKTLYRSNSIGKSLVSYMLGIAICEGYIQSIESDLSDWPLMKNTLYENISLYDLLSMRARDQHIVTEDKGFISSGRWFNDDTVSSFANHELKNTQPNNRQIYNYHGFATNLLMNYIIFKTGEDWYNFLERMVRDRIGFSDQFHFQGKDAPDISGPGHYMFFATRYDYMRFALSLLEDWREQSCVGQYLKNVYEKRVSMRHNFKDPQRMTDVAKSYGGQFLFDFDGVRNRTWFGMSGYGGQNILIDMNSGRIVVVNSAHTNFDWRSLVYKVVKTGSLPK